VYAQLVRHLQETGGQAHISSFISLLQDRDNLSNRATLLTQELGKEQASHKEALVKLTDFASTISALQAQGKTQLEFNQALNEKNEELKKEVDGLRAAVEALKEEVDKNKHLAYFCEWATRFCELVVREARDTFKANNSGAKAPFKTWGEFKGMANQNPAIMSYFTKVPVRLGISEGDWELIVEFKEKRNNTFHPEIDLKVLPVVNLDGDLSIYRAPLEKAVQAVFNDYKLQSAVSYSAMN